MLALSNQRTLCRGRRWHHAGACLALLVLGALLMAVAVSCKRTSEPKRREKSVALGPKINQSFEPALVIRQIDYVIRTKRKIANESPSYTARRNARRELISAFLQRAQFLGDLSAYEEALAVAGEMLTAEHEIADRHVFHAKVLAALHRFDEAEAALDRAEAEGVASDSLELVRVRILLSRGQTAEAFERLGRMRARDSLDFSSTRAVILADLGLRDLAEKEFLRASTAPTLQDPLALAYLWFQEGLMWEREGHEAKARQLYERALERFPDYPALASHLAALEAKRGNAEVAIVRLRELVARTGDPEYIGQLAGLLGESGAEAEAAALIAEATDAYQTLLAKYPLAFSDHAARFYLEVTGEPSRAFDLAERNLANRQTDAAYQLVLDAAHAARTPAAKTRACEIATAAVARPGATAYLLFAGARALRECGENAAAETALARAEHATRQR